ncbi:hypothetical protein GCM10023088_01710 [Actinomadura verrucosospora]
MSATFMADSFGCSYASKASSLTHAPRTCVGEDRQVFGGDGNCDDQTGGEVAGGRAPSGQGLRGAPRSGRPGTTWSISRTVKELAALDHAPCRRVGYCGDGSW